MVTGFVSSNSRHSAILFLITLLVSFLAWLAIVISNKLKYRDKNYVRMDPESVGDLYSRISEIDRINSTESLLEFVRILVSVQSKRFLEGEYALHGEENSALLRKIKVYGSEISDYRFWHRVYGVSEYDSELEALCLRKLDELGRNYQ